MPFAVNSLPCQDPDLLRKQFGSALDLLHGCNSYTCPLGDAVGYAHVLMDKADFDRVNGTGYVTLTIRDGYGKTVTLPDLTVVGSAAAYQTDSSRRANAVVRVTLADRRWRYKMVSVNRQYNYRNSAGTFVTASTNAGTAWTWQGVVDDLWSKLVSPFGVSATGPQFPSAPAGTPEGFNFYGVDVYAAINRVVQAAGYALKFDPTTRAVSVIDPDDLPAAIPSSPPRTFDDGVWTDPAVWATTPLIPENVRTYFPRVGRADAHAVSTATQNADAPAGTFGEAWDDMPAVGDPVSNTTALTNRAAAVAKLWEADRFSRANPNRMEFRGWQDWCRTSIGLGGWTRWSVYDRGNSADGLIGGVLSCVNNLDPIRVEYRPGAAVYMGGGSAITTANVDGTEESETTRLEFDQDTYVRVDAGATDADPDVVSIDTAGLCADATFVACVQSNMTFDVPLEVPDCLSLIVTKTYAGTTLGGQNVLTDVTVTPVWQYKTYQLPAGTPEPTTSACVTPADCCPDGETVVVDCCPDTNLPTTLTLTITGLGSYTMTYDAGVGGWETGVVDLNGCGDFSVGLYCEEGEWVFRDNFSSDATDCDLGVEVDPAMTVVCTPDPGGGVGTIEIEGEVLISGTGCGFACLGPNKAFTIN